MPNISTTYRGYEITYNENTEQWNCYDLESSYSGKDSSSPKLSTIRAKIDKMVTDMRKAAAVEAFEINTNHTSKPSKRNCIVTEYLGNVKGRYSWEPEITPKVASVSLRNGKSKPTRSEIAITMIMPNTREALEAYEDAAAAYREIEKARAVYAERLAAIPRLSLDDIKALVEIHENQQSNPEQE